MDGYDEISLTQDTKIITKYGEEMYSAEDLGFNAVSAESIQAGGNIGETAALFRNILEGKGTEQQNSVVLANAAVALQHTQRYGDYKECLLLAEDSLKSGKALQSLEMLLQ